MEGKAIQDYYPESGAHCFGCGRLNEKGLQIKSYWEGDEAVCRFTPAPQFSGPPGYAYGGLIASLIDCHSSATASAARMSQSGFAPGEGPLARFVLASLKVDYLKPTPLGKVLELRGKVKEMSNRKVIVAVTLTAENEIRAKGEAVMVQAKI